MYEASLTRSAWVKRSFWFI